jgi:hypothetical protein
MDDKFFQQCINEEKQFFIQQCISALQKTALQNNYSEISIKTLKEILTQYIDTYQPPALPANEQINKLKMLNIPEAMLPIPSASILPPIPPMVKSDNIISLADKKSTTSANKQPNTFQTIIRQNQANKDRISQERIKYNKKVMRMNKIKS